MAERDEKGRFAEGNAGGPGRPPRASEAEYLGATVQAVTVEDWQAIVKRAVQDAKAGDAQARRWLAEFVLGKSGTALGKLASIEARAEQKRIIAEEYGGDEYAYTMDQLAGIGGR